MGDGNCLFRSLSYIITGSEDQHFSLRIAIVQHMLSIPHMLLGHGRDGQPNCINLMCHPRHYDSVEHYIQDTRMDQNGEWGTNVTGRVKTGHICTNYTCSENSTFLSLCL